MREYCIISRTNTSLSELYTSIISTHLSEYAVLFQECLHIYANPLSFSGVCTCICEYFVLLREYVHVYTNTQGYFKSTCMFIRIHCVISGMYIYIYD